MKKELFYIDSEQDGLKLEGIIIVPDGEVKGIVQISHGMAEHKERYISFMEFLSEKGYVTVAHDHRGHGKSVKSKEDLGYFYEKKAEYIIEDLHQITQYIKERYPNKKLVLFGHSMGSMVVRKYIKKYDKDIDKLIVCGSPSKNNLVDVAIFLVLLESVFMGDKHRSNFIQKLTFGKNNKKVQNAKSENSWVCANEEAVKKYDEDELCGFTFTLNGFLNLFTMMKDIYSNKNWKLENKELPILFIAGANDSIIINKEKWLESQMFLKNLGYKNIDNKLYDDMRHEILNEATGTVMEDIYNWIQEDY